MGIPFFSVGERHQECAFLAKDWRQRLSCWPKYMKKNRQTMTKHALQVDPGLKIIMTF
jgi:hypothetical protein